ncbi:MAG: nickel insertion protein, partial [Methylocystaceae bacterium]
HFHEVGAVDSIIDIVGAAVCLEYLKVDKIMSSSVQLGGGFVKCAHGIIPIPAPATMEILKNVPVKSGIVPFETTTPTGAAILAANVGTFTDHMDFSVESIGYGIGHRELDIPNVLRVYLGCQGISGSLQDY